MCGLINWFKKIPIPPQVFRSSLRSPAGKAHPFKGGMKDEHLCLKGWATLFGKQIHSSGIGGLKSRLRNSLEVPVAVKRTETTTRECFACGKRHDLSLWDRVIVCDCGWRHDRDVNAALVILRKGLGLSRNQTVGLGRPELKPPERETVARILGSNPCIRASLPL